MMLITITIVSIILMTISSLLPDDTVLEIISFMLAVVMCVCWVIWMIDILIELL